jgi:hypothetical protein
VFSFPPFSSYISPPLLSPSFSPPPALGIKVTSKVVERERNEGREPMDGLAELLSQTGLRRQVLKPV